LFKTGLVHFSTIFLGAPTYSYVAETTQGLKDRVLRIYFFAHRILVFTFFSLFFLLMISLLHDVTFNVTTMI
jgi:hypothetical protein